MLLLHTIGPPGGALEVAAQSKLHHFLFCFALALFVWLICEIIV